MRKHYIIAIVFGVLLLVLLSAANTYLALRNDDSEATKRLIAESTSDTIKATQRLVDQRIGQIEQIPGQDGKDGVTTVIERQTTNVVTTPGKDGQDGRDGKDGQDGKPGKDARQVILSTDPDTGDIIWRYEDETGWTLLMEACKLTKTCEE